jgi:hypothetical protein
VRPLRSLSAAVLALGIVARAAAQPVATDTACAACTRGDALIDRLSLQPLRSLAGELARLELSDPLTAQQYARIVELRRRTTALVRLGAADDADFVVIAAALCRADLGTCTDATARALRCLADRCAVALPDDTRDDDALVSPPERCSPAPEPKRTAPLGVGIEWGTGWQRSRYPADGRAWSLGIQARLRLSDRIGAVARIDRVAGRDEATDEDDNGEDDVWTGSVTRIVALAGPTIALAYSRFEGEPRFLRIDLLGGYLSTRSQDDESGPAAGIDVAYQIWGLRFGMRFVQGFADAQDASMLVGHLGIVAGSMPIDPRRDDCDPNAPPPRRRSPSRMAVGFDIPLSGYGLSSELGWLATGLGMELAWYLTPKLHALARADIVLFPGYERERAIHQAALAGVRIDFHPRRRYSAKTGYFATVMSGYTHGANITPSSTGSGPIGDVSVGWGAQSDDFAAYFRLHGRFGTHPDNSDYRAIFLSGGFEFRLDPRRWRD